MIWQRINPTDEFIEDPGLDKDEVEGMIRAVEYEKTTLKGTVDFNWLPPPLFKNVMPDAQWYPSRIWPLSEKKIREISSFLHP